MCLLAFLLLFLYPWVGVHRVFRAGKSSLPARDKLRKSKGVEEKMGVNFERFCEPATGAAFRQKPPPSGEGSELYMAADLGSVIIMVGRVLDIIELHLPLS